MDKKNCYDCEFCIICGSRQKADEIFKNIRVNTNAINFGEKMKDLFGAVGELCEDFKIKKQKK